MSGKYFYSVVNVENILRPIFTVAHILNQNLLALTNEQIYDRRILIGEMSCGGEGGIETAIGEWEVTGR